MGRTSVKRRLPTLGGEEKRGGGGGGHKPGLAGAFLFPEGLAGCAVGEVRLPDGVEAGPASAKKKIIKV